MDNFLLGLASFVLVLVPGDHPRVGAFHRCEAGRHHRAGVRHRLPAARREALHQRGHALHAQLAAHRRFCASLWRDFVRQKSPDELSADRREIEERGIKNPKRFSRRRPGSDCVLPGRRAGDQLCGGAAAVHLRRPGRPALRPRRCHRLRCGTRFGGGRPACNRAMSSPPSTGNRSSPPTRLTV